MADPKNVRNSTRMNQAIPLVIYPNLEKNKITNHCWAFLQFALGTEDGMDE